MFEEKTNYTFEMNGNEDFDVMAQGYMEEARNFMNNI